MKIDVPSLLIVVEFDILISSDCSTLLERVICRLAISPSRSTNTSIASWPTLNSVVPSVSVTNELPACNMGELSLILRITMIIVVDVQQLPSQIVIVMTLIPGVGSGFISL